MAITRIRFWADRHPLQAYLYYTIWLKSKYSLLKVCRIIKAFVLRRPLSIYDLYWSAQKIEKDLTRRLQDGYSLDVYMYRIPGQLDVRRIDQWPTGWNGRRRYIDFSLRQSFYSKSEVVAYLAARLQKE